MSRGKRHTSVETTRFRLDLSDVSLFKRATQKLGLSKSALARQLVAEGLAKMVENGRLGG